VRLLLEPQAIEDAKLSLALFRYEPGQACSAHVHEQFLELYYIIKGQGVVTLNGEDQEVWESTAVHIPAGVEHKVTNTGGEDLEFLGIFVPPYDFHEIKRDWNRCQSGC
jgi:putative monooxygenase